MHKLIILFILILTITQVNATTDKDYSFERKGNSYNASIFVPVSQSLTDSCLMAVLTDSSHIKSYNSSVIGFPFYSDSVTEMQAGFTFLFIKIKMTYLRKKEDKSVLVSLKKLEQSVRILPEFKATSGVYDIVSENGVKGIRYSQSAVSDKRITAAQEFFIRRFLYKFRRHLLKHLSSIDSGSEK